MRRETGMPMTNPVHPSDRWTQARPWTLRDRVRGLVSQWTIPATWDAVKHVVLFIGTPRAGGSMFGALLDAHPHICLANEYNVLGRYVDPRHPMPSRQALLADLLWMSRRQARSGRAGYSAAGGTYGYSVPEQFQGRFAPPLRVVGAAKAAVTLFVLQRHAGVLERLQDTVAVPIRFMHVVRNPFDLLSTLHKSITRRGTSRLTTHIDNAFLQLLEEHARAMSWHRDCGRIIDRLNASSGGDAVLTVYQEEIVRDPAHHLEQAAAFLGLDANPSWVADCSKIVWNNPHASRNDIAWTKGAVAEVCELIRDCPHLQAYYGGDSLQAALPANVMA